MPIRLNRRHRVALFATLGIAGLMGVFGATFTQTVGIFMFGLAFAWAFGSDSRVVHRLFVVAGVVFGLGLSIVGPWHNYNVEVRAYKVEVERFKNRIPELARRYPINATDLEDAPGHSDDLVPKSKDTPNSSRADSRPTKGRRGHFCGTRFKIVSASQNAGRVRPLLQRFNERGRNTQSGLWIRQNQTTMGRGTGRGLAAFVGTA